MKSLILGLVLLFATGSAFAGVKVIGTGGLVVVCRDTAGDILRTTLLDYEEAVTARQRTLRPPSSSTEYDMVVARILRNLSAFSPLRAARYMDQLMSFEAEALFVQGQTLGQTADGNYFFFPKNCRVEQAIIQREPLIPGDPRYIINQDLWDSMDPFHQAGLVLHELIYREALEYGHEDARRVRYLNAELVHPEFARMSQKKFIQLLIHSGFSRTDLGGLQVNIMYPVKPQTIYRPLPDGTFVSEKVQPASLVPSLLTFDRHGELINLFLGLLSGPSATELLDSGSKKLSYPLARISEPLPRSFLQTLPLSIEFVRQDDGFLYVR